MQLKLLSFLAALAMLCLSAIYANGQPTANQYFLPQLFPRSPSSTGLEKYGTYQVNEFTGVPDISIPLYTIEAGGFKIPITLSYHASGIKITEAASWVGLGWSVSSGGQISRRTMGLPDDYIYGYLYGHMRQQSAYNSSTSDGVHYQDSVARGLCDARPDIYSYDFPGHGGKFFFDGSSGHSFIPRFMPFAPLKVSYNMSTNPTNIPVPNAGAITTFSMTDEHGNYYSFGDVGGTEATFSESGGHLSIPNVASAWKIKNMISQNRRDTVSFTYQSDQISVPTSDNEVYTVADNVNNIAPNTYSPSFSSAPSYIGNLISTTEQLPQQINFKNGKVVFDTVSRQDIGGGRLKDIKIYKYNYGTRAMELQKTVVFYTSLLTGPGRYRMKLDSIQILDKAGSTVQHYRFDYNTSIALPDYVSYDQDYWGYYNGGDLKGNRNTMLTPKQTISYTNGGVTYVTIGQANRNPDSNYMQAGVLTGIHYPSGGYSTFTYQTNQYDTTGVLALAGGLRIHTISSYDGVNPTPIVRTYVYNSARKNFLLDYAYFVNSQTHRYYNLNSSGGDYPEAEGSETVRSYSSNPHCDLEAYDGATVVYPSVTEYIGTPGSNVGRTDYTFTDAPDSYLDASYAAGSLVYLTSFYLRGHLLTKKEYIRKGDGTYQPVKLTTNTYTAFQPVTYGQVGLAIARLNFNEGPVGSNPFEPGQASPDDTNSFWPFYYDIISDDNYQTGSVTNVYDTNDTTKYTTSTVSYKYGNQVHQQITSTSHTDSKGNTIISTSKYPADYLSGNAVIDSMVNRNMQAEVIEKYDTLKNLATGISAVTGGQLNQYKTGINSTTIIPSKISTLSVGQPLTNFVPSTVTSGSLTSDPRYVQMISFDYYDYNNNILQFTPRNATPTSIIWNYNYELPVAQVKNGIYGPGSPQYAYTSFEADNNGGWIYTGAPVYNPTAPTGSMVYPLSSGSISSVSINSTLAYVISYWSNNGAATVYAGSYLTSTPLTTVNGWTYYECQVPAGATGATISGTTTIDELRLYPSAAQMTTYAYDPSGLRSISDTKGMNSNFEYDFAQRLKNVKDFYGNITGNYAYHLYDQSIASQAQSATFTRNNCPPNTTPGTLVYSVAAGKYYSSTLASANADAIYDLNTNGQIQANANCGCPVIMVNFTLSNSSGLSYQVTFSGIATPYQFPASGSTIIQVPQGTYATVATSGGSTSHNFSLTGYPSQNGVHLATFNNVSVMAGSNLTLSVQ
jgi:hypothetical protein